MQEDQSRILEVLRTTTGTDLVSDDDDDAELRPSPKKRRVSTPNDSANSATSFDDDSGLDELLESLAPLTTLRRDVISEQEKLASIATSWAAAESELPLCAAMFKDLHALPASPAEGTAVFSLLLDNLLTRIITISSSDTSCPRPFNAYNNGLNTPL